MELSGYNLHGYGPLDHAIALKNNANCNFVPQPRAFKLMRVPDRVKRLWLKYFEICAMHGQKTVEMVQSICESLMKKNLIKCNYLITSTSFIIYTKLIVEHTVGSADTCFTILQNHFLYVFSFTPHSRDSISSVA